MAKLYTSISYERTGLTDGLIDLYAPSPCHFWAGIGWAKIPQLDIGSALCLGTCTAIIGPHGRFALNGYLLRLLSCGRIGAMGSKDAYVIQGNNWRWPLWWLLLHIWLFLRWFERNLRLTAAVWDLLNVRWEPCRNGAISWCGGG